MVTGHSGHNRNSPQGLDTISIRVFDQIRDPEHHLREIAYFIMKCIIFFNVGYL